MAQQRAKEFPTLLATIKAIFADASPPHIIAVLGSYGLRVGATKDGVEDKSLIASINQHHIELLQALALTEPQARWGKRAATQDEIQKTQTTIVQLADAFHQRRLMTTADIEDREERTAASLQENLRMNTQIVRNWGYFGDVVRLSTELYAPLDVPLRQHLGFGATDLITTARAIITILERRFSERFKVLRRVFKERSVARIAAKFFENYPYAIGTAEQYLATVPADATVEMVKYNLLMEADADLVECNTITAEELSDECGFSVEIVTRVLEGLSLKPGALSDKNLEHLFLDNPIWIAPIIAFEDRFFCPIPHAIFSHIHDILRSFADKSGSKTTLEDRRAEFLEAKVSELFAVALPGSTQWSNARWQLSGTTYETDLILKIDRTIIIAEAKSATITGPALRGAPDRLKRHVRELIVEPSQQSKRLEELLISAKSGSAEAISSLATLDQSLLDFDTVVRVSVTLDDFSTLSSAEPELQSAGWIPNDAQLACTLSVADLGCVIDILNDPGRLVHYFIERQRFQKSVETMADELDFLGFYLQTSFNIWSLEKQKTRLVITGMSRSVDQYYIGRDAGIKVEKPKVKVRPYFDSVLKTLQHRKQAGWLSVTLDLLRLLDYGEQSQLEAALEKLKRNVTKHWQQVDNESSVIMIPPAIREAAAVFYVYPPQLAAVCRQNLKQLGYQALVETGRSRCVVVGRDTSRWDQPYTLVGLLRAPLN